MIPPIRWAASLVLLCLTSVAHAGGADPLLEKIQAVGKQGKGNAAAAGAWRQLTQQGTDALTDILAAIDPQNPVAANYLRSAFESIADRALSSGRGLPVAKLEAFVRDTGRSGVARRLAYEWLVKADPQAPGRLLPGMLDDPGAELRRDAVATVVEEAEKAMKEGNEPAARRLYAQAFRHARDFDQVKELAKKVEESGTEVDLTKRFGYVTDWLVIGPFDSTDGSGYTKGFPPEKETRPETAYAGKGKQVRWQQAPAGKGDDGTVDFNEIFGDLHDVVGYGLAVVESPREMPVEVRAESNNAVKIYLNGREIYSREEYHHGTKMDQHVGRGVLKAGRNEVLVKVCQNNQTDSWAQQWSFRLRLCDHLGAALPVTVTTAESAAAIGGQ